MISNKGDAQERLQCPYSSVHMIDKHRMQPHLVKCSRDYPGFPHVTCTFNTTHRVPEPELAYHLSICPDRVQMDKFTYKSDDVQGAEVKFPIPVLNVEPTESWDDHEEVAAYVPDDHCKNNPILRNSKTKSAAQRRNFHMEERARWQQFDDCAPSTSSYQQPSTSQKQRRPAGRSEGIQNDKEFDICDIMEKISLDDTLKTPKVPVLAQKFPELPKPTAINEKEFSQLNDDVDNSEFKAAAPWGAASLAIKGVASNNEPTKRSYGRGSFLAKKN